MKHGQSLQKLRTKGVEILNKMPDNSYITTAQLAKKLNTNLQNVHNWKLRGILPPPSHSKKLKGNKNYYRVSRLKARLQYAY